MISLKHLVHYTSQLSMAVRSGMPITTLLRSLEKSAVTRRLRTISTGVRKEIESGATLGQAFGKYRNSFPEMFTSLIEIGERTGHLEQVTSHLSAYYRDRYNVIRDMKWGLVQTGVYAFICIILLIFIKYVLKGWDDAFLYTAVFHFGIGILLFLVLPWVLYKNCRSFRVAFLVFFSVMPGTGWLMRKFSIYRFSAGMAIGLGTGMEIRETIRFSARAMGNPLLERRAVRAVDHIESGLTISESLIKTGIFPTLVGHLYETGEQSGKLFEMMQHVAEVTRQQAQDALKAFTIIVSRLLYVGMIAYFAFQVIMFWHRYYQRILDF